ncbi:MAG TPA: DNA recombination protein RmuC [Ferruginibacter sp.]|nr:DNA recombination protein RmuC [Ferruginibacter sp.]HRO96969.1 DNA recombination protein RmuC [Ferruginibacter sp.]HRP50640.1 DNA recombination protein RmuC [Ferruginibacter sp.]
MENIYWILAAVLLVLFIYVLIRLRHLPSQADMQQLQQDMYRFQHEVRDAFRINREENMTLARLNREELFNHLKQYGDQVQQGLAGMQESFVQKSDALAARMEAVHRLNREEQSAGLQRFSQEQQEYFRQMQAAQLERAQQMTQGLRDFSETFDRSVRNFNDVQREQFGRLEQRQQELVKHTESKLESIRVTVEEKLDKTLSERLGQSFETVGKQLIEVQKGLGEMQTIAADVGGLKKVLSNVKLRGGVGEVQLAMLLEQTLAPNQYDTNVCTKKGSADAVEFAVKLPGAGHEGGHFVYMPLDAKFPKDAYEHLLAAYESAAPEAIESAAKNMEATIRKMAKDMRDKYIDPPHTTDFAILFLPFESIYAEVIRRTALVDQLRDEFKITVAGPTTLMAILNSFQMGFRTLALQKRSSEVWEVLSKVKGEFEKFGGMLEKAQKNIQTGLGQLDDVVGTRTRAIQRQLRDVESLPAVEYRSEDEEL